MALDENVADLLKMEGMAGARESARLSGAVDRNLVQGLGIVNTTLIQTHGGTADDAATLAAMRTANYIPELGNAKPQQGGAS